MNGFIATSIVAAPAPTASVPALRELRHRCFASLCRDYNPTGFAETLIVRELSVYAARMIRDDSLLTTADEQAEKILQFVLDPTVHRECAEDANSELCTSAIGTLAREARQNANLFFAGLRELKQLQRDRQTLPALIVPDFRFASESQCSLYLARRFYLGSQGCRHCGANCNGSWHPARRCWQCAACHTQTCARSGTVMAHSQLPLTTWFHAIRIVLCQPNIAAVELAAAINIRRVQTVNAVVKRIRSAIVAENVSQLLAELDQVYLGAI